MIETLKSLDYHFFSLLNGVHSDYFDNLMWLVSMPVVWLPLMLMFLYTIFHKGWKQALSVLLAVMLFFLITDQLTSSIIKPLVGRLRPSRDPFLAGTVHSVNGYIGGMYGFVSGHAANHVGVAMLTGLLFRNRLLWLSTMLWAWLVSYSRIYLGVHFPGDILCGAMMGCFIACLVYWLWRLYQKKNCKWQELHLFNGHDAKVLSYTVAGNFLLLALIAFFYVF